MVNTVWVNADHWCDLHPLANHITKLQNFAKEENCDFSAILFSLSPEQALTNLIICLMISQKLHTKVAQLSWHVAMDTR